MATDFYRLTTPAPCKVGDTVQVGTLFYKVLQLEPMYYEFRNRQLGVELGFATGIYPVPDLIPPPNYLYYINAIGIDGLMTVQIRYQAGAPRNTVGARSSLRLTRFQAHYLRPFNFRFVLLSSDTLECDIETRTPPTGNGWLCAVWFYGWKITVKRLETVPQGETVTVLEDVRQA